MYYPSIAPPPISSSEQLEVINNMTISNQLVVSYAKLISLQPDVVGLYIEQTTGVHKAGFFIINLIEQTIITHSLALPDQLDSGAHNFYCQMVSHTIYITFLGYRNLDQPEGGKIYFFYSYALRSEVSLANSSQSDLMVVHPGERLKLIEQRQIDSNLIVLDYQTPALRILLSYQLPSTDTAKPALQDSNELSCGCTIIDPIQLIGVVYSSSGLTYFYPHGNSSWTISNSSRLKYWRIASDANGSVFSVTRYDDSQQNIVLVYTQSVANQVQLVESEIVGLETYPNSVIQSLVKLDAFIIVKLF